jgi:RNA polymerase sigma factor (sigma-70 family)
MGEQAVLEKVVQSASPQTKYLDMTDYKSYIQSISAYPKLTYSETIRIAAERDNAYAKLKDAVYSDYHGAVHFSRTIKKSICSRIEKRRNFDCFVDDSRLEQANIALAKNLYSLSKIKRKLGGKLHGKVASNVLALLQSMPFKKEKVIETARQIIKSQEAGKRNHAIAELYEKYYAKIEQIVSGHLGIVVPLAKKYDTGENREKMQLMDMIQEGNIALIRAAIKYVGSKGPFECYAHFWINRDIKRKIYGTGEIRLPEHLRKKISRKRASERFLLNKKGVAYPDEVAELSGLAVEEITLLDQACRKLVDVIENADSMPANNSPLAALLSKEDTELKQKILDKMPSVLTEKQVEILKLRYGIGKKVLNLHEIIAKLGISKQAVDDHEKTALRKLKLAFSYMVL